VLTLGTPRLGAAAAVVGTKLVVAGGTDMGPMIEVLNDDETAFVASSFPPDPTQGLGVTALDATNALAVGGKDPATGTAAGLRTLDVACAASCATTELAALPMALGRTKAFVLAPNRIMVTGESDDGQNHALLVDTSAAPPTFTEKVLREPRKGATAIWLPTSQVGFVGGQVVATGASATSIEAYFP
jgi:hypothetical protein